MLDIGTFVESNPCSDTFISVKRSKKLVEHQCKIKFGSVIGLLTKNKDDSSPVRDVMEKPKILDSDINIAPVNLKFSISGSPSACREVKRIGSEGSRKECKKRPYGLNQETQILDMDNISDSNSDNCSSPDEKGNACRDNSDTDVDEELQLHTSRTRPKDQSAVKVELAAASSSASSSSSSLTANNVAPINEIVLSDQYNESGDESDKESVDLLGEVSPSDSDEEDYHEVEHDENGDSLLDIERREAREREEQEERERVESDEGEQTEEDEDDEEEERLRREEDQRIEEEEAEEEKEKERLRIEEEEQEEDERIEKEAEEMKRREEEEAVEEEREEVKRSVMEEEKKLKMKEEDSDILREGEEGALMHNNPGTSSSLPHCASQNEESSLSQRSGYSKACDMLLTASTAIASPSAAILLGSNFKHEVRNNNAAAGAFNNDEEIQQTKAISTRRMTGRKSKRNESHEADNISSAELVTSVTDAKDDPPRDLTTEVDNTVHRGKRAKTVKILPSSAVIETQATSTVRSVKRTVESAQSSQVNNESEANDQHSQTGRIEGSAKGKKTALGDTERLSASSASQSQPAGDRLDRDEKDEKIQKDNDNPVRIINTGLLYGEEEFEELARACGAVVAALPSNATHIVTTDTIKRTPKVERSSGL